MPAGILFAGHDPDSVVAVIAELIVISRLRDQPGPGTQKRYPLFDGSI
ncbi:MAG: hypothetical protein ACRESS_03730 [Stenotrophobium sp.]